MLIRVGELESQVHVEGVFKTDTDFTLKTDQVFSVHAT